MSRKFPGPITFLCALSLLIISCGNSNQSKHDYPIQRITFENVKIKSNFWSPRLEMLGDVSIPHGFEMLENHGTFDNFRKAAGLIDREIVHQGHRTTDSDLYKMIEATSNSLAIFSNPSLESKIDSLILLVQMAQEDNGYIHTGRYIQFAGKHHKERLGKEPLTHPMSEELYVLGHLYESAVAHYQATGKKNLLNVALRNADFVYEKLYNKEDPYIPNHEEIELALAKLYRLAGDQRYLDLSKYFLDNRGSKRELEIAAEYQINPKQRQNHLPVTQQTKAVGHCVRATYLYSAMSEVDALLNRTDYKNALNHIWQDIVNRKLYITGGIGVQDCPDGLSESFHNSYHLPNEGAYCESCASVGLAMWAYRMFLSSGDAQFLDVFERVLYNGVLPGISLTGDRFFYQNKLYSPGRERFDWTGTFCCPPNIMRFLGKIGNYVYAVKDDELFINMFVGSSAPVKTKQSTVQVEQTTDYPWNGHIKIKLNPQKPAQFAVHIRIPSWVQAIPVPGDLYEYQNKDQKNIELKINGKTESITIEKGFVTLKRQWKPGDEIDLVLPMTVKKVVSNTEIDENRGKMAIERGPLVYCAEGIDNKTRISSLKISENVKFQAEYKKDLLGGIVAISATKNGTSAGIVHFVPYFTWANRGSAEMSVWLNTNH